MANYSQQPTHTKFSKIISHFNGKLPSQVMPPINAHVQGSNYTTSSTTTSYSLPDSSLLLYPELEELLTILDPIKGKATYLLAIFLNDEYNVPFNNSLIMASEIITQENDLTAEIMKTILSDGYQESLATLLKMSKNLENN
jgi:hypothetical protein